ncbi:MAG: hypothetical protein ACI35S_03335 [Anaeroplasma sp.]
MFITIKIEMDYSGINIKELDSFITNVRGYKMMENKLTYYLAYLTEETLFAYGNYYEFFRVYNSKNKEWVTSKLTFSQLLHDFITKEISEETAKEITDGNLPLTQYQHYCELISSYK